MTQTILVLLVFAVACRYVGRMIYQNLNSKDNTACNGCAASKLHNIKMD